MGKGKLILIVLVAEQVKGGPEESVTQRVILKVPKLLKTEIAFSKIEEFGLPPLIVHEKESPVAEEQGAPLMGSSS